MRKRLLTAAVALALILLACHPVFAQARVDRAGGDRSYYMEPRASDSRMPPGAAEDRPMESQRWVRVGYDYNDDGYIDRFEYLNVYDLERARRRSMERQREAGMSPRDLRGYYPGQAAPGEARAGRVPLNTVAGTVMDLREIGFAGMDQKHLIGKLRTSDGRTARVDFGPVGNLSSLNLSQGEWVTVHGTAGTINDTVMLMAHRIETGQRHVTVGWPNDRHLSRYSGEILNVRTAGFTDPNVPEQVFARVLLDQGGVTTVNLGPRHVLQDVAPPGELRGKHIGFLAHPAKIGDRVALVAEELRVDGRTVHVDWSMAAPGS